MGVEVNLSPFPNKLIRHQYLEIRDREAPTCCIFQVLETLQAQLHTPLKKKKTQTNSGICHCTKTILKRHLIEYNNICGCYY